MPSIWELHQKTRLKILGLMSGTSMDGLDVCLTDISRNKNEIEVHIVKYSEYKYDAEFKKLLSRIPKGTTETVCRMNFIIANTYVELIRRFFDEHGISVDDIDLIGSHGQTVWHDHRHSTLQIGEAAVLAEAFKIPVVSDFRVRDVAAGGSGAPLAPFVDYLLFKKIHKNLMILNIGGIANFTFIPASAKTTDDIYALDTGPGNSLIDISAELFSGGTQTFDQDGKIAQSGTIRQDILNYLMERPYIGAKMPKSTGREIFGRNVIEDIISKFKLNSTDYGDLTATVTRFTVEAIFYNYQQFFANNFSIDEIIVSGGGADNPVIINHLETLFADVPIKRSDDYGITGDAKEALAFAVLAAATIWEIPGNVPNVTGARRPVVLGKITI
ncbi:MAG: anhydro-N-acetylmuramic acid kinase [Candidatus Marinimicrobia bacterium]|nr:anhydro-N-acetylmuramic acid kinase [Candidatus Neomarinimicrobiota bacterium]